jgi:hypothetical protein
MTLNPDGSVTLTPAEARGVDALLSAVNRRARDASIYTSEDATRLAREWAVAREQR